jgi:hypothetical protein
MSPARPRTLLIVSQVVLLLTLTTPASLRAQDSAPNALGQAPTDVVENAKYQFAGAVNANAVYVRSGPSDNDYPVMKLDKGATVTVVGARFEWLKIVPPEGAFCYVAKAYVERRGDGTLGRVTNKLNVRIGSTLNAMKTKLAMQLEPERDVTIMGEQDEYFKIKPPEGVYLYVNKQFVDPVKALADSTPPSGAAMSPEQMQQPMRGPDAMASESSGSSGGSFASTATPATQPETVAAAMPGNLMARDTNTPPTTAPSTQPALAAGDVEAEFDRLEIAYGEMIKKPLDEQDIPEMMSGYQKVAASNALPETLRRIADAKVMMLQNRMKDRDDFLAFKKQQDEMKQRQMALQAEREELEQRLKATDMKYFTAVGVLRPSSLQQGPMTLYRLTDPGNGRTVVYVRSNDDKMGLLMGQFIGVKGEMATDQQLNLKVITPERFEACDPAKLYTNVAAQIIPPSLMPGGMGTATTGNE